MIHLVSRRHGLVGTRRWWVLDLVTGDRGGSELPVAAAHVEVTGSNVSGRSGRCGCDCQRLTARRPVHSLQSQQIGTQRPRAEAQLALDVVAPRRPSDARQLVAHVRRPQHVAVLSDDQPRRVDQLRRTDPARKHITNTGTSTTAPFDTTLVLVTHLVVVYDILWLAWGITRSEPYDVTYLFIFRTENVREGPHFTPGQLTD